MSNNFHGIDSEEEEQDEMKTKLDLITVTSSKNLETMETNIATNNAKNSYPSADATKMGNISVTSSVDLNTMNTSITSNTSAIAGIGGGLFQHLLSIKRATPNFFANSGGNLGTDITGSELVNPEITGGVLRLVIDDTGVVVDTESPNNFTFSESGTRIRFGWTQSVVLVFYKFEYYDNSAGSRTVTFGMYDDSNDASKFQIRHDFNMPSSFYIFKQFSGYAGYISIQNYNDYYLHFMSNGGGQIRDIEFLFIRSSLSF